MLYSIILYYAKLTGKVLSRNLNKIASAGLRNAECFRLIGDIKLTGLNNYNEIIIFIL